MKNLASVKIYPATPDLWARAVLLGTVQDLHAARTRGRDQHRGAAQRWVNVQGAFGEILVHSLLDAHDTDAIHASASFCTGARGMDLPTRQCDIKTLTLDARHKYMCVNALSAGRLAEAGCESLLLVGAPFYAAHVAVLGSVSLDSVRARPPFALGATRSFNYPLPRLLFETGAQAAAVSVRQAKKYNAVEIVRRSVSAEVYEKTAQIYHGIETIRLDAARADLERLLESLT